MQIKLEMGVTEIDFNEILDTGSFICCLNTLNVSFIIIKEIIVHNVVSSLIIL